MPSAGPRGAALVALGIVTTLRTLADAAGQWSDALPVGDRAVLGLYHARPAHALPFLVGAGLVVLALRLRRSEPGWGAGMAAGVAWAYVGLGVAGALVAVYCAATGTFGEERGARRAQHAGAHVRLRGAARRLAGVRGGGAGRRAGPARAARAGALARAGGRGGRGRGRARGAGADRRPGGAVPTPAATAWPVPRCRCPEPEAIGGSLPAPAPARTIRPRSSAEPEF